MTRQIKSALRLATGSMVVLAGMALLPGCEVAGVVLHQVVGEPPVHAQYEPPKETTLVLVENYGRPDESQLDSDQIAYQVTDELKHAAKLDVVDIDKLQELREDDVTAYHKMNIAAVGRAAKAKTIIYVDLTESGVTQDPSQGAVHALATAKIRVIDAKSGNTLWPSDATHGKEITQSMEFDQSEGDRIVAMHTQLLTKLSSKIAKLFYTWKPDDQYQENAGG